jgi:hypothetical protein
MAELHQIWFGSQVVTVISSILYFILSLFSSGLSLLLYRSTLISSSIAYGIVLYRKFGPPTRPNYFQNIMKDESFHYLSLALVFLTFSPPIFTVIFPFLIFASFHTASHFKTAVLPSFSSISPKVKEETIALLTKFQASERELLIQVSVMEIYTILFLTVYFFTGYVGFFVLFGYAIFLKFRFHNSSYCQLAFRGIDHRARLAMTHQYCPSVFRIIYGYLYSFISYLGELGYRKDENN